MMNQENRSKKATFILKITAAFAAMAVVSGTSIEMYKLSESLDRSVPEINLTQSID